MNHIQALKEAEMHSKRVNAEMTKFARSNMTRLERDLQRQTSNVLRAFQKSLGLTLQRAYSDHLKALKQKQLLLWMPFLLSCLLLGGTLFWIQQKLEPLSNINPLMAYQTMSYQGQSYVIVPSTNVLKTQDGQYLIQVK